MSKIKIRKTSKDAINPIPGEDSSSYYLYNPEGFELEPYSVYTWMADFDISIPAGYCGILIPSPHLVKDRILSGQVLIPSVEWTMVEIVLTTLDKPKKQLRGQYMARLVIIHNASLELVVVGD